MRLISIILPIFNEELNLPVLLPLLNENLQSLHGYRFEIVCVNDGSEDRSLEVLRQHSERYENIRVLDLSRNFGVQNAITAGMDICVGDAVITMDADLQHPVHVIKDLIGEWEKGAEIVLGQRDNFKRTGMTQLYFWLLSRCSDLNLDSRTSDLRLLDRKVVDELKQFPERQRFIRGMVQWVGFKRAYVSYSVNQRFHGKSTFGIFRLIKLAFFGFASFSVSPLRAALVIGLIILIASFGLLIYMGVMVYFVDPRYFRPIAFVVVFNALLSGLVLVCLGFVANYVGFLHNEVMGRPIYIVREKINFDAK